MGYSEFRMPYARHSLRLGPVLVTTTQQAQGAPIVDGAMAWGEDGTRWRGRAILLKPWRRRERSLGARALVVALRQRGA